MEVVRMSGLGDLLEVMCLRIHAIKTARPRFFFQRVVRFVHDRLQHVRTGESGRFKFCGACGAALEQSVAAREERKVVTVLFADLVGFTSRAESMDPEDVRALLAPYHERLRRELERFGGTLQKFIGDA